MWSVYALVFNWIENQIRIKSIRIRFFRWFPAKMQMNESHFRHRYRLSMVGVVVAIDIIIIIIFIVVVEESSNVEKKERNLSYPFWLIFFFLFLSIEKKRSRNQSKDKISLIREPEGRIFFLLRFNRCHFRFEPPSVCVAQFSITDKIECEI